jgi:hypothetical protein
MTINDILELPKNTRLRSIYDTSETVYTFEKLKSVNNIVHAFIQKIQENNIEIIKFPLNYFQNEFIIYFEQPSEIVEEVIEKKIKK